MAKTTIQERYTPVTVGDAQTVNIPEQSIGGFICVSSGTINISKFTEIGGTIEAILVSFPVTAGVYYPLPMYLGVHGGSFLTAGGATGVLLK